MWRPGKHAGAMLFAVVLCGLAVGADPSRAVFADGKTAEKLKANQPVKIVCLGDSVTGIYYHTGGRRAYPEMLGTALILRYPRADVTVINAGISGNTTVNGLKRLQKDVLDHQPDLVTVIVTLGGATVSKLRPPVLPAEAIWATSKAVSARFQTPISSTMADPASV